MTDHANTVREVLRMDAEQPGLDRALAALDEIEAERDHARDALRQIAAIQENEHQPEPVLGIARAALGDT